ncbi:MAG: PIN domain-containing protein [Burkholderiaceae bacterium]
MNAAFLDTNILIYAHLQVEDDPRCERAYRFLRTSTRFVLSTQVIAEYSARMIRQKLSDAHIYGNVEALLTYYDVRDVSSSTLRTAWGVRQRYGFAYRDSQIVASALEAGCDTLYTEDLQHGQVIEKRLTLVNPLLGD